MLEHQASTRTLFGFFSDYCSTGSDLGEASKDYSTFQKSRPSLHCSNSAWSCPCSGCSLNPASGTKFARWAELAVHNLGQVFRMSGGRTYGGGSRMSGKRMSGEGNSVGRDRQDR